MDFPFEPVKIGSFKAPQRLLQNNPGIPCRVREKLYFQIFAKHTCGSCSHIISRSLKLTLVFLQLDTNTVRVFYFLNTSNYYKRRLFLFET